MENIFILAASLMLFLSCMFLIAIYFIAKMNKVSFWFVFKPLVFNVWSILLLSPALAAIYDKSYIALCIWLGFWMFMLIASHAYRLFAKDFPELCPDVN